MTFLKLTSSTFPGNVDFQMSSKWRPKFLIDNFENVYLEFTPLSLHPDSHNLTKINPIAINDYVDEKRW